MPGYSEIDFSDNSQVEAHIEREVQRRLARQMSQTTGEVSSLREVVEDCKNKLIRQREIISRFASEPLTFGSLLKVHNFTNPALFKVDDEVIVIDPQSPFFQKGGKIVAPADGLPIVTAEGYVLVELTDGSDARFAIGIEGGAPAQIRMTKKDDGTFAVVQLDGRPWEVRGVPDLNLAVGDPVKVIPSTKAIVCKSYELSSGPICEIVAVHDDCVEVLHKGDKFLVHNPRSIDVGEGDRIVTDASLFSIIKKIPQDIRKRYKLSESISTTWDDVGGLDEPKKELRDALELPFQHPDLFSYYGCEPLRGVLLYGPPGCGKTLLVRACAWSVAQTHGVSAVESGYVYVKAPEILDKWVGNTEKEIHSLFDMCRRHFRQHGYKAILAIDEADALMPQRGTRRSSDIADTIVPMFLGEMDGVDSKQTEENPIVFLMTNRADVLDPAVTRPGRISRHIKVGRPNATSCVDILDIHTRNMPFQDGTNKKLTLTVASSDLYSKMHLMYRINGEHDFTLGDCVNGAMLANIAEIAKLNALHRDLHSNTKTGVTTDDFRTAIKKVYAQQKGVNHAYDLQDFAERLGIQSNAMQIERCFGAA